MKNDEGNTCSQTGQWTRTGVNAITSLIDEGKNSVVLVQHIVGGWVRDKQIYFLASPDIISWHNILHVAGI